MNHIEVYILSCHKKHVISLKKIEVPLAQAAGFADIIREIFGNRDMLGIPVVDASGTNFVAIVSARKKKPYNLLFLFKKGSGGDCPFLNFDDDDKKVLNYIAQNLMDGSIEDPC